MEDIVAYSDHVIAARKEDLEVVKQHNDDRGYSSSNVLLTFVHELVETELPMVTIGKNESIKEAYQKLTQHKILSIPVYNQQAGGRYTSFLEITDILIYILTVLQGDLISGYDTISTHPGFLSPVSDLTDKNERNKFVSIGDHSTLANAIETIHRNKVYRVAIVNAKGDLTNVITQSFIVRWLSDKSSSLPIAEKTIGELNIGVSSVISVNINQTADEAFRQLLLNNISGAPVVDNNGKLVSNLSITDAKAIGYETYMLFNLCIPLEGFLKLGKETIRAPVTVTKNTTFADLLITIAENRVHRVYTVKEDGSPDTVISLSDVIAAIAESQQ